MNMNEYMPPHPFFLILPAYQIENSSWVSRNTSVWERDPQTKMFQKDYFRRSCFIACLSYLSFL